MMQHKSFLRASGPIECEINRQLNVESESWFNRSFDCEVRQNDQIYKDPLVPSKETCVAKPASTHTNHRVADCGGYECIHPKSFLVTPDRLNTFHNYAVAQNKERTLFCSENHQFFNNMTRRKIPVTAPSFSAGGVPIDQPTIPMPEMCDVFAQIKQN